MSTESTQSMHDGTYGTNAGGSNRALPGIVDSGTLQDDHLDGVEKSRLRTVVQYMLQSVDDDCDCDTCAKRLDCLAERIATGVPLEPGMEQLQLHLKNCDSCREEFDALVRVIVAQNCGEC